MTKTAPKDTAGTLWVLFLASCFVYGVLLMIGPSYALGTPAIERPMLAVLSLYSIACALYLIALRSSLRGANTPRFGWWVIGTSIALRLLLLPTPPFQEIDIYRYLWDGVVVAEGIDPYAYPPQRVIDAINYPEGAAHDPDLTRLTGVALQRPALHGILQTIHYAGLPSPYPPVSQAVFALAAATSPEAWSAETRLVWLKAALTAFDVGVLLLMLRLLRLAAMHRGWALAYGWCPLVMKEFAGSGHLDSIAVFFATAALAAGAAVFVRSKHPKRDALFASALLGLGVGAKLYPVVLAPLLAIGFWRRIGGRATIHAGAAFLFVAAATLAPMLWPRTQPSVPHGAQLTETRSEAVSLPMPPGASASAAPLESTDKTAGLSAFLKSWEMNDLIFMVVYENLRWQNPEAAWSQPWFDITPNAWSESFRGRSQSAFTLTRGLSAAAFVVIALVAAWRSTSPSGQSPQAAQSWLSAAFLTVAWFWMLAPTQNPWYWCWAAPLVCFARSSAWLCVSVFSFGYYLRFWLESRFPERGVAGTSYDGEYFFYFVLPWIEFGPILMWLAVEALWRRRQAVCNGSQTPAEAAA